MTETIAQIIGIVGLFVNLIIFQQKKQDKVLILQFIATILWFSNFLLLGAYTGAILNGIGTLRSLVYYFEKKTNAKSTLWLIVFTVMYTIPFILTFAVFGKTLNPANFIIEVLPVVAMVVETVGLKVGTPRAVRILRGIASPMWLVYNCFAGSIGAILAEGLSLASIGVGIIRLDIKKQNQLIVEEGSKAPEITPETAVTQE